MAAASDWQPIETVPRDGTPVLVWLEEAHLHSRIHAATFDSNGLGIIGSNFDFDVPKATHWTAQPEGPSPTTEGPDHG